MTFPTLTIDLKKIEHNSRTIVTVCDRLRVQVVGVVKACLGNPDIARAMITGGVTTIADSRLANLERLSGADYDKPVPRIMLRQPMVHEVRRVVELTDQCLVSEFDAIKRISDAATALRKVYGVVIMVETGDLREGILPEDLFSLVERTYRLPWIKIEGVGTNVACLQGVPPTTAMLDLLAENALFLRERLSLDIPVVSGGNSSAWKLLEAGLVPEGITQFRFGEAILLGQETVNLDPIPGTYQDAIMLEAEIIESKVKPIAGSPQEMRERAILALGVQDVCKGILKPLDKDLKILRRSSDHLVVDVTDSGGDYRVGDTMAFIPSYEAMLAAMTSPFVDKVFMS